MKFPLLDGLISKFNSRILNVASSKSNIVEKQPVLVSYFIGKKREIVQFLKKHNRRPIQGKNPYEFRLHKTMSMYLSPSSAVFDADFRKYVYELIPLKRDPTKAWDAKPIILEFIRTNGRKPSSISNNKEERKLADRMHCYIASSRAVYDPVFREQIDQLIGIQINAVELHKQEILDFIIKEKRFPCHFNPNERELSYRLKSYTEKSRMFDPDFKRKIKQLSCFGPTEQRKNLIRQWCLKHGHQPSRHLRQNVEDIEVYSMFMYFSRSDYAGYDLAFKKEIQKYPTFNDFNKIKKLGIR